MRIGRLELYYAVFPLIYPWTTAYGSDLDVHTILVKLASGDHEGWGETTPLYAPCYSPESSVGVYYTIREYFAPQIVGQEFETAREIGERLKHFKGNFFAKAGVENAWWMLKARMEGKPLHKLLGGTRQVVESGTAHGIKENLDMLMEAIQKGIDAGYKRTKLKFARGWALEMLKPVRKNFPKHTFHIDCNSSFTLDDLPMFKEVDKLGLAMIEQPLPYDDLVEHAKLQAQLETPICLDESIKSVRDMRLAIELKSGRYVNIKHGRVGGLQAALDIHNLARDNGIPAWVGGMLESSLAVGISVELGTLENFLYPNDVGASSQFIKEDITDPVIEFPGEEKVFKPSTVPGVPYLPSPKRLKETSREKFVLEKK
jgi:O-succinylbenzoate synthase